MNGDLTLLIDAARRAGATAMRYWRATPKAWEKPGGAGPVSEADLAVNDLLAGDLRAARPAYGWLSEESADDRARLQAHKCFIIDPIDGTRAFLDGSPDFALSLAVADAGRISAAVVYLPAKDRLYTASADGAALCNDRPIRRSDRTTLDGATLLTARASLAPDHWRHGQPPPVARNFRSSLAWRLCLVAEGAYDAMMTLRPTWEWDVAAGSLIAMRAGALATDRHGEPLLFNRPAPRTAGCITATPVIHDALLERLLP